MKCDLIVATCQFPVSGDVEQNAAYILSHLATAKKKDADIAHFSESSLSGYAGIDFARMENQDQRVLQSALDRIAEATARLKIWAILGGHEFEEGIDKPYNCLWVIDDTGAIVKRYDKRFCFGNPGEGEHAYYHPGRDPVQFTVNGVTCGMLICHEWRYPELYREQKQRGTEVLFQSWYDGNMSTSTYKAEGIEMRSLILGTVRGNAANNYLWISGSNTSKRESSFGSFVVRPDGKVHAQLKRNASSVLITKIDLSKTYTDPSGPWRDRAMAGLLHNDTSDE